MASGMATDGLDLEAIRWARERIRGVVLPTPVVSSPRLSEEAGAEVLLKCENLQHGGAFKARGACNAVFQLTEEEARAGVVTHSSGNHAAALARAARLRGIPAHIVMPRDSAATKLDAVRRLGVAPVLCAPTAEARQAEADRIVRETGATLVHPYNDARVIAGQGTVGLEIAEQAEGLDAVIVPVSGGGLLSGCLIALKTLRPSVRVYGAEPEWADDAHRSLASGRIEKPTRYDTMADGLRAPLGSLTFAIIRDLVDGILLAGEADILNATRMTLTHAKLVAEPSGAVPLACLLAHRERFAGQRVVLVVSGGNLDLSIL